MAKIQELPVNPSVLEWARKSAGLSIPQAAQELKVTAEFIIDIESRNRKPSKTLLRNMARLYKRSFTVLLLPEPPTEENIPTDYRTLPVRRQLIGHETAQSLREARRLQEALSDVAYDAPDIFPVFQPSAITVEDKPSQVASQIRQVINVDVSEQKIWPNPSYAFRQWRGRLQRMGILVVVEDFPREEARGFSLWHPELIPMIVVSRNEAPAAQIFTLFHELAHILLRSDAMCLKQETQTFQGSIETWCNRVAAAALVPENNLYNLIGRTGIKEWPLEELHKIAFQFKVSRHVVAIRLEQLGRAPKGYYGRIKESLDPDDYTIIAKARKTTEKEYRRDVPRQRLAEVGFAATNVILEACKNSVLSTIEAAALLRVRPAKFKRLYDLASAQSQRYG